MAESAAQPDGQHDYEILSRTWTERVWNEGSEELIEQMMSPHCRMKVEGHDEPLSVGEFRRHLRVFRQAVPDVHGHVLSVTAEAERTVTHWRITGTHLGTGLGVPPTGRPIEVVGLSILHFSDGLIVGGEDHWNRGEFLANLRRVEVDEIRERFGLTKRVAEVALLMAERLSHKEIAQHLGIQPNTARRHCEAVLRRLDLSRKSDVARVLGKVSGSVLADPESDHRFQVVRIRQDVASAELRTSVAPSCRRLPGAGVRPAFVFPFPDSSPAAQGSVRD